MIESKPITDKSHNFTPYLVLPLQFAGCWEWYPYPADIRKIIVNYLYISLVLFILINATVMVVVCLYSEFTDMMSNLDTVSDTFPYITSIYVVAYFAIYHTDIYEITDFMNKEFKYSSARGLTNMTMAKSSKSAKNFAFMYTACTICSGTTYAIIPLIKHWWMKTPLQGWYVMDVKDSPYIQFAFFRLYLAQFCMVTALGQLGVFFASSSILLCGQLDIICCSVRNVRFTALLQNGVQHGGLLVSHAGILEDEKFNYSYNDSELVDSVNHYDERVLSTFSRTHWDIYSKEFDEGTEAALKDCAKLCQVVAKYKEMFETFVSPLLVFRVVHVTVYLCMLLYEASQKFEMVTVEYLAALVLDIFIYCYFGNQIIVQADRVSTAAYQCRWQTMGSRPRKLLINILLANQKQMVIRAGRFLPMDLKTFVTILKTSFSYYTLLVQVNERK